MKCLAVGLVAVALFLACCGGGGGSGSGGDGNNPPAADSGLDIRPSNLSCTAFDPEGALAVIPAPGFSGLSFDRPVVLLQHPIDDLRWYVVEQSGRIATFREGDNAAAAAPGSFQGARRDCWEWLSIRSSV